MDFPYIVRRVKVPAEIGSFTGARFIYHTKINGEMESINVTAKGEPYTKDIGRGRKALYIDVFGFGFSGPVMVKKLYTVLKNEGDSC